MESVIIYEYLPDEDKIIKVTHKAKVQGDRYVLDAGKNETTHKMLRSNELGVPISNHIFSLEDNFAKYKKMIIDAMEKRYMEIEKAQIKRRAMLTKLKETCSSQVINIS